MGRRKFPHFSDKIIQVVCYSLYLESIIIAIGLIKSRIL